MTRYFLALSVLILCATSNLWAVKPESKTAHSPLAAFLDRGGIVEIGDQAAGAAENWFLQQKDLPSSFVYGGESSRELLKTWAREAKPPLKQDDRTVYESTWREPGGGLAATWKATVFRDRPAAEFQWSFVNEGKTPYTLTWVNDPSKEPVDTNGRELLKGWKLDSPNQAVIRYQKKP